jgi:hypothetical protein
MTSESNRDRARVMEVADASLDWLSLLRSLYRGDCSDVSSKHLWFLAGTAAFTTGAALTS